MEEGEGERRGGGRGRRARNGCMKPTERDARAGASVVGGKREFALSHPRIYPTPSSQGAGLRYHPCRPAYPGPLFLVPLFFRRLAARPAGRPAMRRSRIGLAWAFVFDASCYIYPALLHYTIPASESSSRFNRRRRPPNAYGPLLVVSFPEKEVSLSLSSPSRNYIFIGCVNFFAN